MATPAPGGARAASSCSADAKPVVKQFSARHVREGGGFLVRRAIGGQELEFAADTDPFLLLDELPRAVYAPLEHPGAPWHPRLGMLTACYVKEGEYRFSSSVGGEGILCGGDCQWVHAGAGLQVAEGGNHPGGALHAFQCFVNLPSRAKKSRPDVQEVRGLERIWCAEGVSARVLAGEVAGARGFTPQPGTPIHFIDFTALPNGSFEHVLPKEMTTALVYVYEGSFAVGPQAAKASQGDVCLLWKHGTSVWFQNIGDGEGGLVLVAGKPVHEHVVRSGPIAVNSNTEMKKVIADLRKRS